MEVNKVCHITLMQYKAQTSSSSIKAELGILVIRISSKKAAHVAGMAHVPMTKSAWSQVRTGG